MIRAAFDPFKERFACVGEGSTVAPEVSTNRLGRAIERRTLPVRSAKFKPASRRRFRRLTDRNGAMKSVLVFLSPMEAEPSALGLGRALTSIRRRLSLPSGALSRTEKS